MSQRPDIRQYVELALQLPQLSRQQAQRIAKELVREGQLAQERAQTYVEELLDRSRKRTEDLVALVRGEVKHQIASLGIATKEDLAKLEARLGDKAASKKTVGKAPPAKKKPAQSKPAQSKPAQKSAALPGV